MHCIQHTVLCYYITYTNIIQNELRLEQLIQEKKYLKPLVKSHKLFEQTLWPIYSNKCMQTIYCMLAENSRTFQRKYVTDVMINFVINSHIHR